MNLSDYEKSLLYLVAEREARGDGLPAMRAVCHVIKNRVVAGWGTFNSCITKRNQFSSMTVLGDSQTIIWPLWDQSVANMVEGVYAGTDPDNTNGSLYYANEAAVSSEWYQDNIIAKMPVKVVIGKQTFR